jgi:hypothetical protein
MEASAPRLTQQLGTPLAAHLAAPEPVAVPPPASPYLDVTATARVFGVRVTPRRFTSSDSPHHVFDSAPTKIDAAVRCRQHAVRQRVPTWNADTQPTVKQSFPDALKSWKRAYERGAQGLRYLGPWSAVATGVLPGPAVAGTSSACAFGGGDDVAARTLQAMVTKEIVLAPSLTLMQLQRCVEALSGLDGPCILAAVGALLRGGFWLAALQV